MIRRTAIAAILVVSSIPGTALAVTAQGQLITRNWSASDRCAKAAQQAYPDFSPESNAKRDATLKQCLAGQNLPPRPSLETPAKP